MLTVMIKWNKPCQKLKIILSLFIAFSLISSVGAACLRPQIVYASVAGTVAGYILTLFASFNTAITNPNVVTAINNTFGSMALEAADAGVIDQGIAAIAANTGFDMASIFSSTAAEATQVIEAAGLTGTAAIAATAGENIAAGAIECAASTSGAVLPVIGGVVLPAVAAVALGIAGGFLIDHIRGNVIDRVKYLMPLDTGLSKLTNLPSDTQSVFNVNGQIYNTPSSTVAVAGLRQSNYVSLFFCNYGPSTTLRSGKDSWGLGGYGRVNLGQLYGDYSVSPNFTVFDNDNDMWNWRQGLANGTIKLNKAYPDIIGIEGNIEGTYDDGNFTLPNIYPIYNYGDTIINYINPTDYQMFVQNANQNFDDGLTGEDTQGDYFDNFVTPYIQAIDDIPDNPNPDIPNPEQKPTVPYPDPEEYPDAIPEVNPIPDTDIAPTAIPYPELPEPTDTEITDTNDKITPFDLKNKFPFCLPFDIHKALSKLKGAREAPYFVWQIPFGDAGQQTVTVDLSEWDEVASILRLLELLLFIVGLAVATRNLIGGT